MESRQRISDACRSVRGGALTGAWREKGGGGGAEAVGGHGHGRTSPTVKKTTALEARGDNLGQIMTHVGPTTLAGVE